MNQNLWGSGLHHMTILVHGCRLLLETCGGTERSSLLESGLWIEPRTGSRSFQKYPEISRCWVIDGFYGNWSHFLADCLFNPTRKLLSECVAPRGSQGRWLFFPREWKEDLGWWATTCCPWTLALLSLNLSRINLHVSLAFHWPFLHREAGERSNPTASSSFCPSEKCLAILPWAGRSAFSSLL